MDFSEILRSLKSGKKATRREWQGTAYVVAGALPDGPGRCLHVSLDGGATMPWRPDHKDIFAEDWTIVP